MSIRALTRMGVDDRICRRLRISPQANRGGELKQILITRVRVLDLRFPTSREQIGSDAVNKDPDYSAAYCVLETDAGIAGHGLTFTLGRGTELAVSAARYLAGFVEGRTLESLTTDLNAFYLQLTGDTQFRWLGPEKGVIHLACGALINAVWDLYAKAEGKPVWRLLADMSPEEIVRCIDFRYNRRCVIAGRRAGDFA